MDNAKLLMEMQTRDHADGTGADCTCPVPRGLPFLLRPMGYGGKALEMMATEIPLIVALVVVTSALSGWFVGFALGPLAFMVIR